MTRMHTRFSLIHRNHRKSRKHCIQTKYSRSYTQFPYTYNHGRVRGRVWSSEMRVPWNVHTTQTQQTDGRFKKIFVAPRHGSTYGNPHRDYSNALINSLCGEYNCGVEIFVRLRGAVCCVCFASESVCVCACIPYVCACVCVRVSMCA
jgi:hypothetical protein